MGVLYYWTEFHEIWICREEFKLGGLGLEIISIALPAALALLADPIASLVDSAFVGHLGN